MDSYTFSEFSGPFPVCNHTEGFNPNENKGYVQGVIGDNIPFEAELWSSKTEQNISIVFPENFDMYEGVDPYEDVLIEHDEGSPIPYQEQVEFTDNGMLTVGMVERGRINNINVIIAYVEYFEKCGLYSFLTEYRNGFLVQVTDVNGNDFLKLNITIWTEDMGELVQCNLDFKPFFEKPDAHQNAKVLEFPTDKRD